MIGTRDASIIGEAGSPAAIAARELLTRNGVGHRWTDLHNDPIAPLLRDELIKGRCLPLIVFPDGSQLEGPERWAGPDGEQDPIATVFVRRNGKIHHSWSSELYFVPTDSGQDFRHIDFMWPLWNIFDRTPDGRGSDWGPRLNYG